MTEAVGAAVSGTSAITVSTHTMASAIIGGTQRKAKYTHTVVSKVKVKREGSHANLGDAKLTQTSAAEFDPT
jgi:hypothetical protein